MSLPKFELNAILTIAPVALVTFMEHIGDITTNGSVVGKDFFKEPGLHRTLLGDGIATAFAGLIGGPANTTYSENTGVLATTKNYNPAVLRVTAIFAILLGFCGKFGAVLQTIPGPVKGGVEIILFGMIAAVGIRTLAEANLDFTHSRNLIIVGLILVTGLGINAATYDAQNFTSSGLVLNLGDVSLSLSGLFVAVIVGVLANLILPNTEDVTD
jgi:uracil permease